MEQIKVEVKHSISKSAWNVVGTKLGGKHKIAICPYETSDTESLTIKWRLEAFEHAKFICDCFNTNYNSIEPSDIKPEVRNGETEWGFMWFDAAKNEHNTQIWAHCITNAVNKFVNKLPKTLVTIDYEVSNSGKYFDISDFDSVKPYI